MTRTDDSKSVSFFTLVKRWVARIFVAKGGCSQSCSKCKNCPFLNKEYDFIIRRKTNLEEDKN